MLATEPIVRSLSLLSGLSDAIIFIQIQAMNLVYKQWHFNCWQIGLSFIPIAIGYLIAWAAFILAFKRNRRQQEMKPFDEHAQFESRLYLLPWAAPCLPLGLLIFGWTSFGPPIPWIAPMLGTALIGISNYAIYMASVDYMISAYGPYSASAIGGNGLARDLLAGITTCFAVPFFKNIDPEHNRTFAWASTILAIIAGLLVVVACYVYVKGPSLRRKSLFARRLASRDGEFQGRHISLLHRPPSVVAAEVAEIAHHVEAAEQVQDLEQGQNVQQVQDVQLVHDAQQAQDVQQLQHAQRAAGARPPAMPIPVPARRLSNSTRGSSPPWPTFGSSAPHGSYMASVHAASRRQSRQASRDVSISPRGGDIPQGGSGSGGPWSSISLNS